MDFKPVLWPTEILAHFETISDYTKDMNLEIGTTGSN